MSRLTIAKLRNHRLLLVLLTLTLCGAIAFICYQLVTNAFLHIMDCSEGRIASHDLGDFSYSTMPSSATDINIYQTKHCTTLLRFDLDPVDLDNFVASTRIKMPLTIRKNLTEVKEFSAIGL